MGLIPEPGPADVVRRQYLASAAGDLDALRATLAPDVEWTEMAGFPLAGTYRTPEGVTANVMEKLASEWDDWSAHDDTYVVEGENVVVLARYTARTGPPARPWLCGWPITSACEADSSSASNSSWTPRSSATRPADGTRFPPDPASASCTVPATLGVRLTANRRGQPSVSGSSGMSAVVPDARRAVLAVGCATTEPSQR